MCVCPLRALLSPRVCVTDSLTLPPPSSLSRDMLGEIGCVWYVSLSSPRSGAVCDSHFFTHLTRTDLVWGGNGVLDGGSEHQMYFVVSCYNSIICILSCYRGGTYCVLVSASLSLFSSVLMGGTPMHAWMSPDDPCISEHDVRCDQQLTWCGIGLAFTRLRLVSRTLPWRPRQRDSASLPMKPTNRKTSPPQ